MADKTLKKSKETKSKQVVSDAERRSLRTWNLRFGLVLLAQAIAVVVVGSAQTVPITTQYLATNALASEVAGHQVLAVATRHLHDVPLSWVVAKFLLIFAVVYLLSATLWRKKYEAWLERGVNKLRWVAFGVGGGSVAVVVAMLSGVSDLGYLGLIFGVTALAALLTLALELLGPERRLGRLLGVGAIAAAVLPWLAFASFITSVILFDGTLPAFMYYTYVSVFLLFCATGLAVYVRTKKLGAWTGTLYTERMFMILGFVAATVVAWQIFAGALL